MGHAPIHSGIAEAASSRPSIDELFCAPIVPGIYNALASRPSIIRTLTFAITTAAATAYYERPITRYCRYCKLAVTGRAWQALLESQMAGCLGDCGDPQQGQPVLQASK